jgi:hypothetical protein
LDTAPGAGKYVFEWEQHKKRVDLGVWMALVVLAVSVVSAVLAVLLALSVWD